jgi:hypothetical protein
MREIQFSLTASQQTHSIAGGRKPDRQPLADASARSCYEHTGIRQTMHSMPSDYFLSCLSALLVSSVLGAGGGGALRSKPS